MIVFFSLFNNTILSQNLLFSETSREEARQIDPEMSQEYEYCTIYNTFNDYDKACASISIHTREGDVTFIKDYSYKNEHGYLVWHGTNNLKESILLLKKNGRITGGVNCNSGTYEISCLNNHNFIIGKVRLDKLGSCDTEPLYSKNDDTPVENSSIFGPGPLPPPNVPIPVIDDTILEYKLLLAYTPQVADFFLFRNNQNAMNDFLELITESVNETYINSGTNVRARLVFSYQTSDNEIGDKGSDLTHFQGIGGSGGSGPFKSDQSRYDEVFGFEDKYNIEVSILIVGYSDGGRASRGTRKAVASRDVAAKTNYTVAHEIGHIFDLEHDRGEFNELVAFFGGLDRKKAYGFTGSKYRTVMSRGVVNPQIRLPQYSDPDNIFPDGERSGRDNTRANRYINVHRGRIVRKPRRDNENLRNFTISSNQTLNLLSNNEIETRNFIVSPSARVNYLLKL